MLRKWKSFASVNVSSLDVVLVVRFLALMVCVFVWVCLLFRGKLLWVITLLGETFCGVTVFLKGSVCGYNCWNSSLMKIPLTTSVGVDYFFWRLCICVCAFVCVYTATNKYKISYFLHHPRTLNIRRLQWVSNSHLFPLHLVICASGGVKNVVIAADNTRIVLASMMAQLADALMARDIIYVFRACVCVCVCCLWFKLHVCLCMCVWIFVFMCESLC